MKKLFAICLISIHLVNITGGRLFYEYLMQQSDAEINRRIELGHYKNDELLEMKVPLNVPYYSSSIEYERYYGEIELDGRFLNYVMRKVVNDTVYLLCLANQEKYELNASGSRFLMDVLGLKDVTKNKNSAEHSKEKKASGADYDDLFNLPGIQKELVYLPAAKHHIIAALSFCLMETADRPPIESLPVIS